MYRCNEDKLTDLEDGERIVFGPITFTQTTSFSGGAGAAQSSVSKTSGRMVGVTNQRVIVEDLDSPDKTQTCANANVQRACSSGRGPPPVPRRPAQAELAGTPGDKRLRMGLAAFGGLDRGTSPRARVGMAFASVACDLDNTSPGAMRD